MAARSIIERLEPSRIEKFWSNVGVANDNDCWLWKGGKSGDGYGVFKVTPTFRTSTHRVAFAIGHGQDPGVGHVCHRCDTPLCCNPSHLFLGDAKINAVDKVLKGRARGRYSKKVRSGPSTPASNDR